MKKQVFFFPLYIFSLILICLPSAYGQKVKLIPCVKIDSFNLSNNACFGDKTGKIKMFVSGGTLPYSYSWSDGSTLANDTLIKAGHYSVTVTDANNCIDSAKTKLEQPDTLLAPATIKNGTCGSKNGSILLNVSGGTGPFKYSWNTGDSSNLLNWLGSSAYTCTITDRNQCTINQVVNVINIPGPQLNMQSAAQPTCNGLKNGQLTLNLKGGTAPFAYVNSDGSTGGFISQTYSIGNLGKGNYTVNVTDANNCSATLPYTINEPDKLTDTLITQLGSCGYANGKVVVMAGGGTLGYSFKWSNGRSTLNAKSDSFNLLATGNYTITVMDKNGCTVMGYTSLYNGVRPEIFELNKIDVSCEGKQDGSIEIAVKSGTAPYTYTWNNHQFTAKDSNLTKGAYTVTVADNNNCTATSAFTIGQPFTLKVNVTAVDTSCLPNHGLLNCAINGGTPPYRYKWNNGSLFNTISHLSPGTYSITITDANQCSGTSMGNIVDHTLPKAAISASKTTIEEGESVNLFASGGVFYNWSPGDILSCIACPNPIAVPLSTTSFKVIVADSMGCIDSAKVEVNVKAQCLGNTDDVFIANVFSPNHDGKNDVLHILGNGIDHIAWTIFDRWGNQVFYTEDQKYGWDGSFENKPMPDGTYMYILKAVCKKNQKAIEFNGNVSIIR